MSENSRNMQAGNEPESDFATSAASGNDVDPGFHNAAGTSATDFVDASATPPKPSLQKLDTSLSLSSSSSKLQHGLVTPVETEGNDLSPRAWSETPGSRRGSQLDEPFSAADVATTISPSATTLPPSAFSVIPSLDDNAIAQWLDPTNADGMSMSMFPNMEEFGLSAGTTPTPVQSQTQPPPPTSASASSSRRSRGAQRPQLPTAQNSSEAMDAGEEESEGASVSGTLAAADGQTDKRTRFLERNRIAAAKCRAKKKEKTSELEAEVRGLNAKNEAYNALSASLRDELLYLRGEILKHASCGDAAIDAHLAQQVGNITSAKRQKNSRRRATARVASSTSTSILATPTAATPDDTSPGDAAAARSSKMDVASAATSDDGTSSLRAGGSKNLDKHGYGHGHGHGRSEQALGQQPPRLRREKRHMEVEPTMEPSPEADLQDATFDQVMADGDFEQLLLNI